MCRIILRTQFRKLCNRVERQVRRTTYQHVARPLAGGNNWAASSARRRDAAAIWPVKTDGTRSFRCHDSAHKFSSPLTTALGNYTIPGKNQFCNLVLAGRIIKETFKYFVHCKIFKTWIADNFFTIKFLLGNDFQYFACLLKLKNSNFIFTQLLCVN